MKSVTHLLDEYMTLTFGSVQRYTPPDPWVALPRLRGSCISVFLKWI